MKTMPGGASSRQMPYAGWCKEHARMLYRETAGRYRTPQ